VTFTYRVTDFFRVTFSMFIFLDARGDNCRVNAPPPAEAIIQIDADRWSWFHDPVQTVVATTPDGVSSAIAEVERLTREFAYHAVGYVSYEAGAAYGLPVNLSEASLPLVWFGLFEAANVQDIPRLAVVGPVDVDDLAPTVDRAAFCIAFDTIKRHLAEGDSYQVNFTFKMRGVFSGDPKRLFANLVEAQGGSYSAFLSLGPFAICSASPELFFALDGARISARPMKGTAARGCTSVDDEARRDQLRDSAKQRAENVMIVDMVRNDLGKIADIGSISAPQLFSVERYPNVWQMTSHVQATSRASLEEILAALHPSASVTGAPKHRTMEIIRTLEREPRGVYTGAIGHIRPDGNGRFNVAIRTAVIRTDTGEIEFGVGSGIVWDSDADAEYDECLLKGAVLTHPTPVFDLLETTAWDRSGGFRFLERHLERMRASAEYFGFVYSDAAVRAALGAALSGVSEPRRVRWLVAKDGAVRVEHQPLSTWGPRPMRVTLAQAPVRPDDRFLFHKTTNRRVYESARMDGYDDVILWNTRGELTESTTANLIVELPDGTMATPPVSCGLLAGTARADALHSGSAVERIVTVAELHAARRVWLTNSVHGVREAVLAAAEAGR
jgi:para-aminobenzoate synthetase/4-amino-4-deoxychorismate lyase